MKRTKGFTLIELLVVIVIIAILAVISFISYNKFFKLAECGGHKEQHRKVVALAEDTYNFCRIDGSTYLNKRGKCNSNARYTRNLKKRNGMTQIRQEGNKCIDVKCEKTKRHIVSSLGICEACPFYKIPNKDGRTCK